MKCKRRARAVLILTFGATCAFRIYFASIAAVVSGTDDNVEAFPVCAVLDSVVFNNLVYFGKLGFRLSGCNIHYG